MAENNLSLREAFTSYTQKIKNYIAENSGGGTASISTTVALSASEWTNNSQTVSVDGVTASNTVIVSPAPSYQDDYTSANIKCIEQSEGSLTFNCGTTPLTDITVNVVIL